MIKIAAETLEQAYKDAAALLECSVTELKIEVIQYPSKGFLGLFKKGAVIVADKELKESNQVEKFEKKSKVQDIHTTSKSEPLKTPIKSKTQGETKTEIKPQESAKIKKYSPPAQEQKEQTMSTQTVLNNTILPTSFVSIQDDEDEANYEPVYADESYENDIKIPNLAQTAITIKEEINKLFDLTCFSIDEIEVSIYDANTLLIEFKGEDAALLIGKEGYRYKALSYMIFNWINTKYQVQLRLEIAEFLKNQEEAVSRYLVNVCENVDRDGRAQTKILDGVLVQIALRELREIYSDKYVAIRSTRDGLKYIIINDYHSN